jgi:putative transposase
MRRFEIPEQLTDASLWPGVDASALDSARQATYLQREQAVRSYLQGASLAQIERQLHIDRSTVRRLLERCLTPHSDGRIQGFRALIPHARAKHYERTLPARRRSSPGGLSGAMGQLFAQLPQLPRIIERAISSGSLRLSDSDRLAGLGDVHVKLLAACREAGLGARDYPFNQEGGGYRSLSVWVRRRLQSRVPLSVVRRSDHAWNATVRPFSVVELDGHKLDLRVRVRFVDASGIPIDLESERLFVITLIDVCTRVVLGWQLVPAPQYDHHDVLATLQDALRPRRRRAQFSSPALAYRAGAGFVADVMPQLAGACWDVLKLDNAASHLTEDAFEPICRFVGCRMEAGPVGEPAVRPYIERFFGTLAERLSSKLPGATGRHPRDPAGQRGRKTALALLVTWQELEELLDVSIAHYHATSHDGLNGRSPLEALQFALEHQTTPVRTLPQLLRERLHQLQPVHLATVRGSVARGVAPYVSLYGARYSSEVLQRSPGLAGKRIRVYLRPDDMREAWAYAATGAELGRLVVQEGWRYSRHTLRLRKHILRERRLGRLRFAGEQDPVQLFALAQRRTGRHKLKDGTVTLQLGEVAVPASAPPARGVTHRPPPSPSAPVDLSDLSVQNF